MTCDGSDGLSCGVDRPLLVKCVHDQAHKTISFASARKCSYDLLRRRVEQSFALYKACFNIAYEDDDNEVVPILSDNDLAEAVFYFSSGSDCSSTSSFCSIMSMAREVTLNIRVHLAYNGPNLSDNASLTSGSDWDRSSIATTSSGRLSRASSSVFDNLHNEAPSPYGLTQLWVQRSQNAPPSTRSQRSRRSRLTREKLPTLFESDFETMDTNGHSPPHSALSDASHSSEEGSTEQDTESFWQPTCDPHVEYDDYEHQFYRKPCGCKRLRWTAPPTDPPAEENHEVDCDSCGESIFGVRWQCASCPSNPSAYNLCNNCETRSYLVHDPMHIFLKIPRPVDRPIQEVTSIFSTPFDSEIYLVPVGLFPELDPNASAEDYLCSVIHANSTCSQCKGRIRGRWFHCAYCSLDLCLLCEANDMHDPTHVFVVFKSQVNTKRFFTYPVLDHGTARYTAPIGYSALIPYPVYNS